MGFFLLFDFFSGLVVLIDFVIEEEERGFLFVLDWGFFLGGEYYYMLDIRILFNIMLYFRILKIVLKVYLVYIDIFVILLIFYKFNGSILFCDFVVFELNC